MRIDARIVSVRITNSTRQVSEVAKNRKVSRNSFGGYKLISVKDEGGDWEALIWVKAKNLKEFDRMPTEEKTEKVLVGCPKKVPMMCFPADGYINVRSECKSALEGKVNEDGNCPFLFCYADDGDYGCRLKTKNAGDRVYKKDMWG